jgi:Spy/CpxP family protein refolding chaperone
MFRAALFALLGGLIVLSTGNLVGQDTKKDDPKTTEKKDDPKAKGFLPQNWGKLGLTEAQKQDVYKIQNKYNADIDKLETQIRELKSARDKEMKAVLTPEQKKRLEDILLGKDK